jgi:hypothetical protein
MSNDFTPINTPESDAPMFAPIPSWERGKKRRSFGGVRESRVAAEPRSFAPTEAPSTTLSGDAMAYETRLDTVDPTDTSFAGTPVYADRNVARKGNGAAPIAIAAGVILLGGLAAAGYYAYQPHNAGVAELTPGSATTTTTDVASTAPVAADQQVAQNTAPTRPAVATTTTTTTRAKAPAQQRTTVTRTASRAASRSASDTAANASANAPVQAAPAPMPMPTPAAPAAAAPPAPLVLNIPPAAAAPTATAPADTPAPTQTPPN